LQPTEKSFARADLQAVDPVLVGEVLV
jgi:hypothetical protein